MSLHINPATGKPDLVSSPSDIRSLISATAPVSYSSTTGIISLAINSTNLKTTLGQLNTIQNIATTSTPTFAGLTVNGSATVNGYTQIGVLNSQTTPNTNGGGGMGSLWNYGGGTAEMALFNQFPTGGGFTAGFRFLQGTSTNTYTDLAWIKYNSGVASFGLTADSSGTDWVISRDGTSQSATLSGRMQVNDGTTSTSVSRSAFSAGSNFAPSGSSTARVWGLAFSVVHTGANNATDGWALNGFEGNAGTSGSAVVAGANGGIMYVYNSGSGRLTAGYGLNLIDIVNTSTGHIDAAYNLRIAGRPAYTDNSQIRVAALFDSFNPVPGAFTSTKTAQIWFNFNGTAAIDGIAWGTALDTIIWRAASGNLTLNSSQTITGLQLAPTAHLMVTGFTPAGVGGGGGTNASKAIQALGGTGGATSAKNQVGGIGGGYIWQGGVGGASTNSGGSTSIGGAGGSFSWNAGAGGVGFNGNGAAGTMSWYKSNASTLLQQMNDTGLGWFAATPVAQQSGDIGTALVAFGLMSSATTTTNIMATGRAAAQTAAVTTVTSYSVPAADHSYLITANVNVTTSTIHSFTVTCAYTDETNTARTLTLSFIQIGGGTPIATITNGTGAGPYEGVPNHIRCKASTSITIATTGTFTTVTYNVEAAVVLVS